MATLRPEISRAIDIARNFQAHFSLLADSPQTSPAPCRPTLSNTEKRLQLLSGEPPRLRQRSKSLDMLPVAFYVEDGVPETDFWPWAFNSFVSELSSEKYDEACSSLFLIGAGLVQGWYDDHISAQVFDSFFSLCNSTVVGVRDKGQNIPGWIFLYAELASHSSSHATNPNFDSFRTSLAYSKLTLDQLKRACTQLKGDFCPLSLAEESTIDYDNYLTRQSIQELQIVDPATQARVWRKRDEKIFDLIDFEDFVYLDPPIQIYFAPALLDHLCADLLSLKRFDRVSYSWMMLVELIGNALDRNQVQPSAIDCLQLLALEIVSKIGIEEFLHVCDSSVWACHTLLISTIRVK